MVPALTAWTSAFIPGVHAFSFASAAVNAFLATQTASTVAAPTGAGKRASQILPGRETMVTGRSSPSFHGMSKPSDGNSPPTTAPLKPALVAFTNPGAWSELSLKSSTMLSPFFVTAMRTR